MSIVGGRRARRLRTTSLLHTRQVRHPLDPTWVEIHKSNTHKHTHAVFEDSVSSDSWKENSNLLTERGLCLLSGSWKAMHTYVYTHMLHRFIPGLHAHIYIFIRAYTVYLFTCVKNANMGTLTNTQTPSHKHAHICMCTCNTQTVTHTNTRTLTWYTIRIKVCLVHALGISTWACGTCRKLFETSIAGSLC